MKKFILLITLLNAYAAISQCTLSINLNIVNATDSSSCNGSVTAIPIGNNGPVTYSWNCNGCVSVNSPSLTGLCAGASGSLVVVDTAGCMGTAIWNIGVSPCSNFGATVSTTPTTGLNICNGSLFVSPFGGVSPYYFSVSNGTVSFGSNNPSNLCAGTYTINVSDANGCSFSASTTVGVDTCAGLAVSLSNVVNTSSPALCDGSASAVVSGGSAPYVYSWSNGMTGSNAYNLCAGNYSVCIADMNGCQVCDSVFISDSSNVCQGFNAIAQTTNATDAISCDGSMTIVPYGGTAPYTYSFANAGTTATATNLCVGTYTATVTDVNGCYAVVTGIIGSNNSLPGDTIIVNGNITIDSSFVGIDSSEWIYNCAILYDSIINGYISGYSNISADSVIVDWVLNYINGDSVIISAVYNMNSGNGTYLLTLLVFCPQKATPKYLIVNSAFDFEYSELIENTSADLFIYPNPSNDKIQINDLPISSEFSIFDLNGKEVLFGEYDHSIDVSTLQQGYYLIKLDIEGRKQVLRFTK
jgi:hypothetical protein